MMTIVRKHPVVLGVSLALFVAIVSAEMVTPANVVIAYGFVLPILLIAAARNRPLMYLTVTLCILATYVGLLRPTKPGRFVSALINRSVVAGVLVGVAYLAMTREERKGREDAARAELLQAHAQLDEIKDALNRAERLAAVGQLVASVAHEVGTPLHSIAWHVQALGEDPAMTPEMRKRVEIVDTQIARVVRIIEELLSSTRQRKPKLAPLPMDRLVPPVVALMAPSLSAKGVALQAEPWDGDMLLRGDVEQLQQVLVNLIANALAATEPGGRVAITVAQRPATPEETEAGSRTGESPARTMVTVTVRDTGCGMPEEDLSRASEPFFTTKAIGDGSGLGLFLSRQIVNAHGGALSIESRVGQGTTVAIALPGCHGPQGTEPDSVSV
ncbi:MAG: sensor histidine kinase [Nitrospiraceae bacterium]